MARKGSSLPSETGDRAGRGVVAALGGDGSGDGSGDGVDALDGDALRRNRPEDDEEEEEEEDDDEEEEETGDDVIEEQSDPQRDPMTDSRRWFNMCDVNAAAVL